MNLEEQIKNLNLSLAKEKQEDAKPTLEEQIKNFNLSFTTEETKEEVQEDLQLSIPPELKIPYSEEIRAQLTELKTQVHNATRLQDEIDKLKEKKPPQKENPHQAKYNQIKNGAKSTVFSIISFVLSALVVIGYIVFCVLDAKRGWAIFYPEDGIFTLTYLLKVVAIGLFGGAVAVIIIILLGMGIDLLIDKIRLASYDSIHAKALKAAIEADDNAYAEIVTKFEEKKNAEIEEYTKKLLDAVPVLKNL